MRLYHVAEAELVLAHELTAKGIVNMLNDDSMLVTQSLSDLVFSPSGTFFAAITGRLVQVSIVTSPTEYMATTTPAWSLCVAQVFALYSALHGGLPARIHILRGHANNITTMSWSPDDRHLWTASEVICALENTTPPCTSLT